MVNYLTEVRDEAMMYVDVLAKILSSSRASAFLVWQLKTPCLLEYLLGTSQLHEKSQRVPQILTFGTLPSYEFVFH